MHIKIVNFECKSKGWNVGPQMRSYIGCIYSIFNFIFVCFLGSRSFRKVIHCNNDPFLRVIGIKSVNNEIVLLGKCAYIIQRYVLFVFLKIFDNNIFQSMSLRFTYCFD
jgi:hypothetical protein